MIECKHEPKLFHAYHETMAVRLGGRTRPVFVCTKCNEYVYRPEPWLDWVKVDGARIEKAGAA